MMNVLQIFAIVSIFGILYIVLKLWQKVHRMEPFEKNNNLRDNMSKKQVNSQCANLSSTPELE